MKTIDPFNGSDKNGCTYSAPRVIVGHCPQCTNVLVVFNDYESWPLVACACGWTGSLGEFPHVRVERDVYEPIEVKGYFPEGANVRVRRENADEIEVLGFVKEVGFVDRRMVGMPPSERGSTNLRARLVVRP